jgi:hypothetical protein
MKRTAFLVSAFVLTNLLVTTPIIRPGADEEDFRAAIKNLGRTFGGNYRADTYIRAAQVLQKMGKVQACLLLGRCAEDPVSRAPVGDLCRLVFKAKNGNTFRRQGIGAFGFVGGTDYKDWPLDPFEIVDGVPFVVRNSRGPFAGLPESDKAYLEYCIRECDWNDLKFAPKSEKEKNIAFNKLLNSSKWKRPLTIWDRYFLLRQIL